MSIVLSFHDSYEKRENWARQGIAGKTSTEECTMLVFTFCTLSVWDKSQSRIVDALVACQ